MSKFLIDNSTLTNIANEIRKKLSISDTMTAAEMADNISQIGEQGVDYTSLATLIVGNIEEEEED